jgi:hypothetical protein
VIPALARPFSKALLPSIVRVWPALVLAVVAALPWLWSPLFLDDWHLLWKASHADWSWSGLTGAFTFLDPGSISTWNLPEADAYHYFRPLVVALLKLEYLAWGTVPVGYHLVSLVLHLISILLVGRLLALVIGSEPVGRFGAIFFALQPHNIATVCWTAGQTEALGAPLMLAALVCYVSARRGRGRWYFAGSIAFTILACLTKENAVLIGACAGVWELHLLLSGEESRRQWLNEALPRLTALGLVLVGFLVFRFWVFDSMGTLGEPYFTSPLSTGFLIFASAKMVHYLAALITTIPIVPLFGTQFIANSPLILIGGAGLAVTFFVVVARRASRRKVAALGVGWMTVSFLPTLPILASDLYPYFAGIGYALLLAGALVGPGKLLRALRIALIVFYLASSFGRGLLYHTQGVADRTAVQNIESDNSGPLNHPVTLLFVNMPVSVSHVTSHLRLRAGNADIQGVLVTLTPEWTLPTSGPEVECLGPKHVRIGPPPGRKSLFASPEEWNVHLFRVPLEQGKRYETTLGFDAVPRWRDDEVIALDLYFEQPLSQSQLRLFSFYLDDNGNLAHRVCL